MTTLRTTLAAVAVVITLLATTTGFVYRDRLTEWLDNSLETPTDNSPGESTSQAETDFQPATNALINFTPAPLDPIPNSETVLVQDDTLRSTNQALLVSTNEYADMLPLRLSQGWNELARYSTVLRSGGTSLTGFALDSSRADSVGVYYQDPTTGDVSTLSLDEPATTALTRTPILQGTTLTYLLAPTSDVLDSRDVPGPYGGVVAYSLATPTVYRRTLDLSTRTATDTAISLPPELLESLWTVQELSNSTFFETPYLVFTEFSAADLPDEESPQFFYNLDTGRYDDITFDDIPRTSYRVEDDTLYRDDTILNQFELRKGLRLALVATTPERLYLAAVGPASEVIIATNLLTYNLDTGNIDVILDNTYSRPDESPAFASDFYVLAPLLVDLPAPTSPTN